MEFSDENIAREMARSLGEDAEDLFVDDEGGLSSFGYDVAKVEVSGGPEYVVVEDEDTAYALALAVVTQDLETEPEIFNQSFLESHINQDALKRWVYEAIMEDDYWDEIAEHQPEDFWSQYEDWTGKSAPEEDEDGDLPEPDEDQIEAVKSAAARERADDPMDWLEDIYGREDAVKKAMEVAGFDIEAAAEEAVNVDGWAHFLSRYDGNYAETDSGFVYWREN